ncbi:MAG: hypothetical protein AAB890_03220 [Patescibacteria group bacterium]
MLKRVNFREFFLVFSVIILISVLFTLTYNQITDADGFYHIKHSWIYRQQGVLDSSFPWAQYSVINQYSGDIWYGFHVLLLPFTFFSNLVSGIKIGSVAIMAGSLLLVWLAFHRLKFSAPLFWLLFFTFASADALYRFTTLRPHPISLALSLLIFSFLIVRLESPKKHFWVLLVIASVFSWVHLSMSWLPVLIVLTIGGIRLLKHQRPDYLSSFAVVLGLLVGWFARPNFWETAKIAYIQIVQLFLSKDLPLRFGRELTPFVWENFVDQLIPITLFLLAGISVLFYLMFRERDGFFRNLFNCSTPALASLVLTAIFGYMSFGVARRSIEIFVGFAVIFLASISGLFLEKYPGFLKRVTSDIGKLALTGAVLTLLFFMAVKNIYRFSTYVPHSFDPRQLQEVSNWLKEHTRPGQIVFNIHWDRFAQLFFWNDHNYYINGMDPIFQYAYSPELYWKTHFYAIDKATEFTCGEIRCTEEQLISTYEALKRDFKASYLILEKRRNPELKKFLEGVRAPQFYVAIETADEVLYYIK